MPPTPAKHATGWLRAEYHRSKAQTRYASSFFADDRPLPPAFSLSGFRLRHMEQGACGTCWMTAPAMAFEVMTAAQDDPAAPAVELSRMIIGWQGERIMARGGNPDDGGSVTAAFQAMGDAPLGVGVCHAQLWPYAADRAALAAEPPPGAIEDAGLNRVHQVAEVPIDRWQRLIYNGHPIAIGIGWTYAWDTTGGTVFTHYNPDPGAGHALCVMGWMPYQGGIAWQLDNWHGLLYAPLSPGDAAAVPGYRPITSTMTSDFWVAHPALARAMADGEAVTAASATGFRARDITWSWDGQ